LRERKEKLDERKRVLALLQREKVEKTKKVSETRASANDMPKTSQDSKPVVSIKLDATTEELKKQLMNVGVTTPKQAE
jgi:hypothetical protein